MLEDYMYPQLGDYQNGSQNEKNLNNKSHIITFQKNYAVTLEFTEGQVLEINDWIIDKCNSTKLVEYQKQMIPKKIINMAELEGNTAVITRNTAHDTTFLEVQPGKTANLYLEFKAGDMMYLNNWLGRALFEPLIDSNNPLSSPKSIKLVEQGIIACSTIEYSEPAKVMLKSNLGKSYY